MSSFFSEKVLSVTHWNDNVFSFRLTRDPGFRFESGQFVMVGLLVDGRPLMRAYSIASAAFEPYLEFLSIKVPDGPLTSRLQHIKVGDEVLVGRKPTGTLVTRDLSPGKRIYLLGTGTGLAPFMSLVLDPSLYEQFEKIVLVHGVRLRSDLAYRDYLEWEIRDHEYLGPLAEEKLIYYPTVTRQRFRFQGRVTDLIETGKLFEDTKLPPLHHETDRVMICGSPHMLKTLSQLLDEKGFQISPGVGQPGDYVIERAFVPS